MLILDMLRFQITKVRDRWGYPKEERPNRFEVNEGSVYTTAAESRSSATVSFLTWQAAEKGSNCQRS
jgi:hypothetical protein